MLYKIWTLEYPGGERLGRGEGVEGKKTIGDHQNHMKRILVYLRALRTWCGTKWVPAKNRLRTTGLRYMYRLVNEVFIVQVNMFVYHRSLTTSCFFFPR